MSTRLKSNELRMSDYYSHPIWGFVDDDSNEVMPVDYPGHLRWSDGGESLFVLCEYMLNDGTKMDGVIGVRMTNRSPYILKFPSRTGSLFYFPINSPLEGKVRPAQLVSHLSKTTKEIFPIRFSTPFIFEDGQKLEGKYDLPHNQSENLAEN